ncbi:O-antigen/teichoic acid export membrane protein [Arthrobacter roseus]|nr:O-antigen/teichoic acid export membrane protein [Arthrobacter roseus]
MSTVLLQVGLVILLAGLPLAITRAYFDHDDGAGRSRAIAGASSILSVLIAAVAVLISVVLLSASGDLAANLPFVLTLPAMGLLSVVVSCQAFLRAEQKALHFIILSAGSSLFPHALGLTAILVLRADATVYMAAFCLGMATTALAALLMARPTAPGRQPQAVKEAIFIGLPVLPHSLAMILLMQGDSLLLKVLEGDVASGRYIAAAAFALGPFAVLAGLNNVWTPRIMSAVSAGTASDDVRAVTRNAVIVAAVLGFGGIAGANLGMHVLAGDLPELVQLAKVLPLVSVGYALYLVSMAVLFALKRTRSFAYMTLLITLITGLLAILPAESQNLTVLAAVKVFGFTALGFVYLLFARRAGATALSGSPFVLLLVSLSATTLLALLIPTTVAAGLWTLLGSSGIALAATFVVRRRLNKFKAI